MRSFSPWAAQVPPRNIGHRGLRELPENRQETIARAILEFASHDDEVYHLTAEERREVRAGLAEIERGEIASDEEVRAVYKRMGL